MSQYEIVRIVITDKDNRVVRLNVPAVNRPAPELIDKATAHLTDYVLASHDRDMPMSLGDFAIYLLSMASQETA